ncbi:MAG: diguanylate cyclase [Candidatus Obscuribacter sp.]|nr:diguanylate cyclase [Candidatus Obscuribacter sp.]
MPSADQNSKDQSQGKSDATDAAQSGKDNLGQNLSQQIWSDITWSTLKNDATISSSSFLPQYTGLDASNHEKEPKDGRTSREESSTGKPAGGNLDRLEQALTDGPDARSRSGSNELVRTILSTLNHEQFKELDAAFRAKHHISLADEIKNNKHLGADTKAAFSIYEKGVDNRTSEDILKLTSIAVKSHNFQMFSEALGGDSNEAKAAKQVLKEELKNPKSEFAREFNALTLPSQVTLPIDGSLTQPLPPAWDPRAAEDLLGGGRVSLSSIVEQNDGVFTDNEANISLALQNATPHERDLYRQGKKEAEISTLTAEQISRLPEDNALKFYSDLHAKLAKVGDASQVEAWEEQIAQGKKFVLSSLVEVQTSHWFVKDSHSAKDLYGKVESMTEDQWSDIHNHKNKNDPYWQELSKSLNTFATPQESKNVLEMLQRKAQADSFAEAQDIKRPLNDVLAQNYTKTGRDGHNSLSGDGRENAVESIASMSSADAKRYQTDATFKKDVDRVVPLLNEEQKVYANALLKQVETSGEPPKINAELQILADKAQKAAPDTTIKNIETALSDPSLRQRLNQQEDWLSPEDRALKQTIKAQITEDFGKTAYDSLMKTGRIPLTDKVTADKPITIDTYNEIAALPKGGQEQKAVLTALADRPAEMAIAMNIIAQGKPDTADTAAAFINGDKSQIKELTKALGDGDLDKARKDYAQKYGGLNESLSSLDQDLLRTATPEQAKDLKIALSGKSPDGQQALYDHVSSKDTSGIVDDGTKGTLQRASQEFREKVAAANKAHEELTPDEVKRLTQYGNEAITQYQESKKALADTVATTGITVGSLAAMPFTGGLSLNSIGLIATAGGASDVATHAIVEGNNYDRHEALKDFAGGAAMTGSMFMGGELAAKTLNVGREIAASAAKNIATDAGHLATADGTALLAAGKEAELSLAMQKMLQEKLGSGGNILAKADLEALAAKFVTHPENGENVAALTNLMQLSLSEKIGTRFAQAAQSAQLQTLGFGTGGALNEINQIDGSKSTVENALSVTEGALIGAATGIIPGVGRLVGKQHIAEETTAVAHSEIANPDLAGAARSNDLYTHPVDATASAQDKGKITDHIPQPFQRKELQDLREAIVTDHVSGLRNQKGTYEGIEAGIAKAQKDGTPYTLIGIDANGLKDFNDTYGHATGDQALKAVGDYLKKRFARESDVSGRLHGDEYLVGVRNTPEQLKAIQAEMNDVRLAVELKKDKTGATIIDEKGMPVAAGVRVVKPGDAIKPDEVIVLNSGISAGFAQLKPEAGKLKPAQLRENLEKEADQNMYSAKEAKRAANQEFADKVAQQGLDLNTELKKRFQAVAPKEFILSGDDPGKLDRLMNGARRVRDNIPVELARPIYARRLEDTATRVPETGLLKKWAADQQAEHVVEVAAKQNPPKPVSVMSMDLDGLKNLNDKYGHSAGSEMINTFGKWLKARGREGDVVSHPYGADEFEIMAYNATPEQLANFKAQLDGIRFVGKMETTPSGKQTISEIRVLKPGEEPTKGENVIPFAGVSVGVAKVEQEAGAGAAQAYKTAQQKADAQVLIDKERREHEGKRVPRGTLLSTHN